MLTQEQKDAMRQQLLQKYAAAQDTSGIDNAKDSADNANLVSRLGEALSTAATADATSRGGAAPNLSMYQGMRDQARQAIKDAVEARQGKISGVQGELGMQQGFNAEDRADQGAQLAQDQFGFKKQQAGEENALKARHLTNEEMKNKDLGAFHQGTLQYQNAALAQKDRELTQTQQLKSEEQQAKLQDKNETNQNKAYSELRNHLETFRGNRGAQQASVDVYSADKAMQMIGNRDPNTLTTQDLSLLSSELAKIATGGVPTEHGVQQLMPNNLTTKMAEMQNFLSSKPTDAQSAEYIKHNQEYLKGMVTESKKTLNNFRKNITKGYADRIRPDQLSEVQKDYGLTDEPKMVKVMDPKTGLVHLIPEDQVQNAVNKGGGKVVP